MKTKYRKYFTWKFHPKYNIEIRCNKENYVFMYCNKSVKDFDKKAKRIYSKTLRNLIKRVYGEI